MTKCGRSFFKEPPLISTGWRSLLLIGDESNTIGIMFIIESIIEEASDEV